jgi:hypothetical protein
MTQTEATAEVFWMALKALPRKEQQAFIRRVLRDEKLHRDLIDLAVIEERHSEPARPVRKYLRQSAARRLYNAAEMTR